MVRKRGQRERAAKKKAGPSAPVVGSRFYDFAQATWFAKICQSFYHACMSTMNISLPEMLKAFVDEQVSQRGYGTSSEYVRELIRREQERQQLRGLLLAGAASKPTRAVDGAYFDALRARARQAAQ